jgi:hypothetical protein
MVVDRDNLDAVWAALCSLGDGAELATAAAHLDWQMPPRGKANVAFVERYGAGALAWLRTRVGNGVLTNHPWCVLPCVMELDDPGALDLLLDVDGVLADGGSMTAWVFSRAPVPDDRAALDAAALDLVLAWTRRHPDVAYPRLAERARTSARAADALRALAAKAPTDVAARLAAAGEGGLVAALELPTAVSVDAILAELGTASEQSWPVFHANVDGRLEYFGQRVIAVRAPQGDGWAIVFERMQGSDPDMFQIARYAYGPYTTNGLDFDQFHGLDFELAGEDDAPVFRGSIATGPAGALRIDESIFARHDLRPGRNTEHGSWSARAIAIRAYLAEHPGCYWPPADEALGASGLPDGEVLFVADAYQHPCYAAADEDEHPWQIGVAESPVMRSLIDAVIARDPARFEPGDSNLDWRLHAVCASEFALPWTEYHVDTSAGFVAAAMRQAGVAVDDRGLMPLAEAQAICATATSLARGEGRYVGDAWVWDHDRVWAALLSLPTAAAAAAVFGRLDLADGPRSAAANRALAERYGDGALAIVASRARADGVIAAPTPLLRTTVLAVGTPAGFRFVWDTTGWDEAGAGTPDEQASALFAAWVHPQVGFVELGGWPPVATRRRWRSCRPGARRRPAGVRLAARRAGRGDRGRALRARGADRRSGAIARAGLPRPLGGPGRRRVAALRDRRWAVARVPRAAADRRAGRRGRRLGGGDRAPRGLRRHAEDPALRLRRRSAVRAQGRRRGGADRARPRARRALRRRPRRRRAVRAARLLDQDRRRASAGGAGARAAARSRRRRCGRRRRPRSPRSAAPTPR